MFADPTAAAALLRHALPAARDAIAWSTLRPVSGHAVDDRLGPREADLVFAAEIRGGAPLLFVVEHKSDQTKDAVLQLLEYALRLLRAAARTGADELPLVVPVLVHHGDRPWRQPVSLAGLLPPPLPPLPRPTFAFQLLDLADRDEREVAGWDLPPLAVLALLHLQFARRSTPAELVAACRRWTSLFRAAAGGPGGLAALQVLHTYTLVVTDLPTAVLGAAMARIFGPRGTETVMSTADRLIAQGKLEGKLEGKAEQLLLLLHRRFGAAAESAAARVRSATAPELDRWTLRVLDAASLDAVFA